MLEKGPSQQKAFYVGQVYFEVFQQNSLLNVKKIMRHTRIYLVFIEIRDQFRLRDIKKHNLFGNAKTVFLQNKTRTIM